MKFVYFSSATNDTHRFVERPGFDADCIPLRKNEGPLQVTQPYVLIVPTYGEGDLGGTTPRQVITFLNSLENRSHYMGVISSGNTNSDTAYYLTGDIVIAELNVPHIYKFEFLGAAEGVS